MRRNYEVDIAIIGAGPAGLAAASVVRPGMKAIVVDDNPAVGGQIWRAERGLISPHAARILKSIESNGNVELLSGAQVFDVSNRHLRAETSDGVAEIGFRKLIIATGARELLLPFPGWTLPNVFGAGGLQALVKGGVDVHGKRIVVAGSGPLLLAVAAYLKSKGARIVAVAEQAPRSRIMKFGFGLLRTPKKLVEAARIGAALLGTRIEFDSYVASASGAGRLERVTLRTPRGDETLDCDMLACGYHLVPNTELAELLGCRIENGAVVVDDRLETTVKDVFCAGETAGVGGVETALFEGELAGKAASGEDVASSLVGENRRFARALGECYKLRDELRTLAAPETIICRCEDARFADVARCENFRDAKLRTRAGMGACRGRVCGSALRFMFGWERDAVRPPIFPVRVENLGLGRNEQVELNRE